ncbi:MAG: copper resistance protein CopC, partial [Acidimicrobiia bacterium]
MTRRALRLLLAALVAGIGLVALVPSPAAAHATLVASDPADGARLDAAPAQVRLTFSERVSADLGGLQVVDAGGSRVDRGAVEVTGSVVEVGLRPDLPDGTYVATYRIVSADGHPVRGGLVFSVGEAPADAGALDRFYDSSADRGWEVAGVLGRIAAYGGVLLAAGGAAFLVLAHDGGPDRGALAHSVRWAALVGALGIVASLPIAAALGTGTGVGAITEDGVLRAVLGEGVGPAVATGLGGLALAVALLDRWPSGALVGAFAAATSFAWSGHTRASEPVWRATLADTAHLVAAAAWLGGLVLLWQLLRIRRATGAAPAATAGVVARFSTVAAASLAGVAVLGLVLAWTEVRALDALTSTTYGGLLLAKVALVVAVVSIAAYNRFGLVPALRGGRARGALARLRTTLALEGAGLALVVVLTAVLVNVTPARVSAGLDGGVVEAIVELGDAGSAQLLIDPGRAGRNQIHLYTYDATGRPAALGESVRLERSQPEAGIGPLTREPRRAG